MSAFFATVAAGFLIVVHVFGAWCAWRAIDTARTPQGAAGWVVALLFVPMMSVPFFLVFGQPRMRGYLTARREAQRASPGFSRKGAPDAAIPAPDPTGFAPASRPSAKGDPIRAFERLAALPVTSGNAFDLLIDGEATFSAIFDAIRGAKRLIQVQSYLLHDDQLGRAMKDLLIARAGDGLTVRVLFDEIGSNALPASYPKALRDAGVEIFGFHTRRRPKHPFQINFRNHRKIVVVDGEIGFVGGLNVGDEYMGRSASIGPWRDTHLRLKGPAAAQLQMVFNEDWRWATGEAPDAPEAPAPQPDGIDALILAPGPADPLATGTLYFCNAIGAARRRIWIATPYFVPDPEVLAALKLAALRGVEVRIIMPAQRDNLVVWLAAHAYFDEIREVGIDIRLHAPGFMHQKVVLVDDAFAAVGSVNLDIRSCRLNFECTAILFDPRATAEIEAMLAKDFEGAARQTTPRRDARPLIRYGAPVARLFAPVL